MKTVQDLMPVVSGHFLTERLPADWAGLPYTKVLALIEAHKTEDYQDWHASDLYQAMLTMAEEIHSEITE